MSRREEILREAQASHVKMTGPHFVKYDAQAVMDKLADRVVELEEKLAVFESAVADAVDSGAAISRERDALRARCAELEEKLAAFEEEHTILSCQTCPEIERLRARCEALEQDRERLDWLLEEQPDMGGAEFYGADRAAIDAARAASPAAEER